MLRNWLRLVLVGMALVPVMIVLLILLGDPMHQTRSWLLLLTAFDAIYWSLCGLLFKRVVLKD